VGLSSNRAGSLPLKMLAVPRYRQCRLADAGDRNSSSRASPQSLWKSLPAKVRQRSGVEFAGPRRYVSATSDWSMNPKSRRLSDEVMRKTRVRAGWRFNLKSSWS